MKNQSAGREAMETKGLTIIKEIKNRILIDEQQSPSSIVSAIWSYYRENYNEDNSVNGAVFEEIIGYVLTVKGCTPFYMQAKVAYIPNVNYDFILFDKDGGPISISAKTTLRERWKQADLEAFVLKNVHRNALSYVVTLDGPAVSTRKARIKECMGLNDFVLADGEEFDSLVQKLQDSNLGVAAVVKEVSAGVALDRVTGGDRYDV